ncbi:hypothetical protein NKG94_39945 [Micromonospora sp. M12]
MPTHLMYAMDAGTGQARWLSHEVTRSRGRTATWTGDRRRRRLPGLGGGELRAGPAQPADLLAPKLEVLADATAGGERTVRLRLTPQRAARLATLHVDTSTATVLRAEVAGGRCR